MISEKLPYENISVISYGVNHIKYGKEIVSGQEDKHITVKFHSGEKKFTLPNAFTEQFLTLEDQDMENLFRRYKEILAKERNLRLQLKDIEIKPY